MLSLQGYNIPSSSSRPHPSCVGTNLLLHSFSYFWIVPSFNEPERAWRGEKWNGLDRPNESPCWSPPALRAKRRLKATIRNNYFKSWDGVRQSIWYTGRYWAYCISPHMIHEYGAVRRMRIGRGNRGARKIPIPMRLHLSKILHYLTWNRTRNAAVGSRRLSSWTMGQHTEENPM
jgi:hypothetical protein